MYEPKRNSGEIIDSFSTLYDRPKARVLVEFPAKSRVSK